MTFNNAFIVGSVGGLIFGALTFSAGMAVQPDSIFMSVIEILEWPLVYWSLRQTAGGHGGGPSIYTFMGGILLYWTVIGAGAGVAWEKFFARKCGHAVSHP